MVLFIPRSVIQFTREFLFLLLFTIFNNYLFTFVVGLIYTTHYFDMFYLFYLGSESYLLSFATFIGFIYFRLSLFQ